MFRTLILCSFALFAVGCANATAPATAAPEAVTLDAEDFSKFQLRTGGDVGRLLGAPPSATPTTFDEGGLKRAVHARGPLKARLATSLTGAR